MRESLTHWPPGSGRLLRRSSRIRVVDAAADPVVAVVAVPLNAVACTALQAGTLMQLDVTSKDPTKAPAG